MGISTFPAATTDLSSLQKLSQSVTVPAATSVVDTNYAFGAGTYTVTCVNTTIARVEFWNGNTLIATGVTVSGTVTLNIATSGTKFRTIIDTGTNIVVNIVQTGQALTISSNSLSGTLDTLTSSGTYNTISNNGYLYVIAVGGGGGGSTGNGGGGNGARGGASGGVSSGVIASTSGMSYTIGAGGLGGNLGGNNSAANTQNGGATTFATNITAQGGSKGNTAGNGTIHDYQAEPGGAWERWAGANVSPSVNPVYGHARYPSMTNVNYAGGNGNIGNGGATANTAAGAAANGYGCGGGSSNEGNANNAKGGTGSPGVIYVLRNWA